MLKEIDRVQLLVPDAAAAAARWQALLGAEEDGRDNVRALAARRVTLRLGTSVVEILEPDGAGRADAALRARGRAHLYAAGVSAPELDRLARHLEARGTPVTAENGQLFLALEVEGREVPFVVSPVAERTPAGDVSFLYEATLLVRDVPGTVALFVGAFGLDAAGFEPIASDVFHYAGTLMLFDPEALHRFEIISPTDPGTTMGRYFARAGVSYYMAFCESARLCDIEARAQAMGAGLTVERPEGRRPDQTPDQMWLHPPALGGMMLGLSRPSMAWSWSGYPERVREVS